MAAPTPAAEAASRRPPRPASVAELLNSCRLSEYADAFEDNGYDDVLYICDAACGLKDADLEPMLDDVGMTKVGHRRKFLTVVGRLRGPAD